jgi:hypothetical protein
LAIVDAVVKMGDKAAENNYLPLQSSDVMAASKVLIPNTTETIAFDAPATEGIYAYTCTYPGHGYVMYGALYVTNKPLPDLKNDKNVSAYALSQQKNTMPSHVHAAPSPHPFALEYPLIYRTFMPDCSPAAIAVALSPSHAYCFDAGKCMLRYVWTGGFIDNTDHWKGNGNALAKIQGKIYYKDTTNFPFSLEKSGQKISVKFKGYSLNKRLPTFKYEINGIKVSETVSSLPHDEGMLRVFVFDQTLRDGLLLDSSYLNHNNIEIKVNGKIQKTVAKLGIMIPKGTKQVTMAVKKQPQ